MKFVGQPITNDGHRDLLVIVDDGARLRIGRINASLDGVEVVAELPYGGFGQMNLVDARRQAHAHQRATASA